MESGRSKPTRLRYGVLGTGSMARHFAASVRASAEVHCSVVASRTLDSARAFAARQAIAHAVGSYAEAIRHAEVDAVYIALPNALHCEWACAALAAGKHVLCEKPLALNAAEVARIASAAAASGCTLLEAYPYRHQPQTIRAFELVESGAIGTVRIVQASCTGTFARGDVRLSESLGGGALLDLGCYPVSVARLLLGARPVRVFASGSIRPEGVDGTLVAQLEQADGALVQIGCSLEGGAQRHATVVGSKGFLEASFDNESWSAQTMSLRICRSATGDVLPETMRLPAIDAVRAEAEGFARVIAGGSWGRGTTLAESMDIAVTLDAITASLRSGRAELTSDFAPA